MRIYCFEIEGEPDWSHGGPVPALDRRTGRPTLLYRSLAIGDNASPGHAQARKTLEGLTPFQSNGSSVHLFSYGQHIGFAAPDELAARPLLEKLRASGLFPAPFVAPPPPPALCANCGKPRGLNASLCPACSRRKRDLRVRLLAFAAILLALLGLSLLVLRGCSRTKAPPAVGFFSDSTRVARGHEAILTWNVSNASSVFIEPGIGRVPSSGSRPVRIEGATTFTLTASGPGGAVSQRITIDAYNLKPRPSSPLPVPQNRTGGEPLLSIPRASSVQPSTPQVAPARPQEPPPQKLTIPPLGPSAPSAQLVTNGSNFRPGDQATLTWTTTNSTHVTISPQPGIVPPSGTWSTPVTATTTFTLTATGPGGETSRSATIDVAPRPPSIELFESESSSISQGQRTALRWRISGSFTSVEVTEAVADRRPGCTVGARSIYSSAASSAAFSSLDIQPRCDAQYTLHVASPGGTLDSRQVAVHVSMAQAPAYTPYGQYPPGAERASPPAYGRPNLPASPTAGNIVWTGQVNPVTHKVSITWFLIKVANGYVWQALSRSGAVVQQGASIFDSQAGNFGYRAEFSSGDNAVQIVATQYDGSHGPPHFTLTFHCDRAGSQTILLRWTKR